MRNFWRPKWLSAPVRCHPPLVAASWLPPNFWVEIAGCCGSAPLNQCHPPFGGNPTPNWCRAPNSGIEMVPPTFGIEMVPPTFCGKYRGLRNFWRPKWLSAARIRMVGRIGRMVPSTFLETRCPSLRDRRGAAPFRCHPPFGQLRPTSRRPPQSVPLTVWAKMGKFWGFRLPAFH